MTRDADQNRGVGSRDSFVTVSSADESVFCPNPTMPLWSSHPRVFLELDVDGEAMCPYCGTRYRLASAARGEATDVEDRSEK